MKKQIAIIELALLVISSFSFAYFVHESNVLFPGYETESNSTKILRKLFIAYFGKNLVSAQSALYTCPATCQEYLSGVCDSQCSSACFPGARADLAQCALGTCFDSVEGTCIDRAPKSICENSGGSWSAQSPAQCNKICCSYGGNSLYTTEVACNRIAENLGFEVSAEPVSNELECLIKAQEDQEGACVLESNFEKGCQFITSGECATRGGEFHAGYLCSNPALDTICEKQKSVACDQRGLSNSVYWFDSCGNRENIYDSNLDRSWNDGLVLPPSESCSLALGNNPLANQGTCGNCNYFASNTCGTPSSSEPSGSSLGNYICKSTSCKDENEKERQNGESWCEFEGTIGLDGTGNNQRSADVPGSAHYKKVCRDGEITMEVCGTGNRDYICNEQVSEAGISSSACVLNEWKTCHAANLDAEKFAKCTESGHCALKPVYIDESFKFDTCVPKYPAGADISSEAGLTDAKTYCALGSKTCTAIFVKKLSGKWDCKANCGCLEPGFTETMNNLCISLGDCGAEYNIEEKYSNEGMAIGGKAQPLGQPAIVTLARLVAEKQNQKLDLNDSRYLSLLGAAEPGEGQGGDFDIDAFKNFEGATGMGLVAGGALVWEAGIHIVSAGLNGIVLEVPAGLTYNVGWGPAFGTIAVAAVGAIIGGAVTAYLIQATGIGAGLPPEVVTALVATGAVGGAAVALAAGASYAGIGTTLVNLLGGALSLGLFGLIVIAVVVIFIVVTALAGVGDSKKKVAVFTCEPWLPQRGGDDCDLCGADGLPCTKYRCQSLGQTCEFLNEGTSEEICANIAQNDVSWPEISLLDNSITSGYKASDETASGFKLRKDDGQCIPAFTPVIFSLEFNEPATCKYSFRSDANYETAEIPFGDSVISKYNQTGIIIMPTLDSLGVPNIDPDTFADLNMHVYCKDKAGNSKPAPYTVNFCVSKEEDLTAPIINGFVPPDNSFIKKDATTKEVFFYTDEPADCRYSEVDSDYSAMSNQAVCNNALEEAGLFGWQCYTNLSISAAEKTFYFRCSDQPWLDDPDYEGNKTGRQRNTNQQSLPYTLKRTQTALTISSVSPNDETIYSASSPVPLNLEITTSGGADGKALCTYTINGGISAGFFQTGGSTHKQSLSTGLFAGSHKIDYSCKDIAGNTAEASSQFIIVVDNSGPKITHVYDLNGVLNVITDEPSECFYSFESCTFDINDANFMSGADKKHTTEFNEELAYSVKCRDSFNNVGSCLTATGGQN